MKWIIGLGNPGSQYEGTRHNVGFEVVDELVRSLKATWKEGKGDYLLSRSQHGSEEIALVKPLTYMNNSGIAVADVVEYFKVALADLLVVCDDFNLPLGRLRLRTKGTDGGHNGLYSIIFQLQSESFPRLRCGIATEKMPGDKAQLAEYVLSVFDSDERSAAKQMVRQATEAALYYAAEGIDRAMTRYNQPIT